MKKWYLGIQALLLIVVSSLCNCSGDQNGSSTGQTLRVNGADVFKSNCIICHGIDGKLGTNGAKDLSASKLPLVDRIQIITNGKALMTPFGQILKPAEIQAVAEYTLTLNKELSQ